MKFVAEIDVMPHRELLDPQGKAVEGGLKRLNIQGAEQVRIGKHIQLTFTAENETAATALVEDACKRLLINPVMEAFSFSLKTI